MHALAVICWALAWALAWCCASIATAAAWAAIRTGHPAAPGWMIAGAFGGAGFVLIGLALW